MNNLPPEKRRAIEAAADQAVKDVKDEMIIGIGTGHAAEKFTNKLLIRVKKENLKIKCVATSLKSKSMVENKIPLIDESLTVTVDITFDGADRADPMTFCLIKGGGGALLREKLVAKKSKKNIILIDDSKLVTPLYGFPLPIEIVQFGHASTVSRIQKLGYKGKLRTKEGSNQPATSDNGNYIFDIELIEPISDPFATHKSLKELTGVIETGLFLKTATSIYVGKPDGTVQVLERK